MTQGSRGGKSCFVSRLPCTQVSLQEYGSRADTFRQSISLRANSLRDGRDFLPALRMLLLLFSLALIVFVSISLFYRDALQGRDQRRPTVFCAPVFWRHCFLPFLSCRLCDDCCDAHRWSLVGYALKAFHIVSGHTAIRRNSVPMDMLILGNSPASREVISPAVPVCVVFEKMIAMPTIRISFATL